MNKQKIANFFKSPILYILLAALLFRLYFFINHGVAWWDASAYIGMGKQIFSGGLYGVNVNFRPLLLPLILGFAWKIGINPLVFGMVFDLALNLASIYLAYIIAKKIINRRAGWIAAILMAISPALIFYSSRVLTENIAVFLTLLCIYFILEKKYFSAGISAGICVWARYPQALLLPAILVFILFIEQNYRIKIRLMKSLKALVGFAVPVSMLALYNLAAFGNAFYQLSEAQNVIAKAGSIIPSPWFFYFGAVIAECFFAVLIFYSAWLSAKEGKKETWLLYIIFAVFFIYYSTVARKEIRYLMVALPALYIPVAHALENLYFRRISGKHAAKYIVIALIALMAVFSFFSMKSMNSDFYRPENPDAMKNFYNSGLVNGKTAISSSPVPIAYNDLKLEVMDQEKYYSYVNATSDYYMFYTCDFYCTTQDCLKTKNTFLNIISKTKKLAYEKELEGCSYLLYENH